MWRRMKAAGAIGLQNGAWALPRTAGHEQFFQELLRLVEEQGASGQIFLAEPVSPEVEQDLIDRSRLDRRREYDEFAEQCQVFLDEIEKETTRRNFSYAELEENEQNLNKLAAWLAKIQERDFFGSDQAATAPSDLDRCRLALETFAQLVYLQDGQDA